MPPRPAGTRTLAISVTALVVACLAAGCSADEEGARATDSVTAAPDADASQSLPVSAVVEEPAGVAVATGRTPGQLVTAVSGALFGSAEIVVVARADDASAVGLAATATAELGVPLLLDEQVASTATATSAEADDLATEIGRLGATTVLAVGSGLESLPDRLPAADVVATATGLDEVEDELPETDPPPPLTGTSVLVRSADPAGTTVDRDPLVIAAATAMAKGVGAALVTSPTADPRASSAAIAALENAPTDSVLAVGSGFGAAERLTTRIAVAASGVELPGGGQTLFPGRALVALYGHPSGGSLGVLGEQGAAASVARAQAVAATYDAVYDVPVVPTFEIIATVASGSAGDDGNYSQEWSVSSLTPFVDAATEAGMYVVLDLQPGRADLVEQASAYQSLLERPNVGLAIDPEWALTSTQKPLQQIGSVSAAQVNAVVTWLADLTAAKALPQKLLVLHQFRTSMLRDEKSLDVSRDELAVLIHADGQGGRSAKEGTWNAIVAAAPDGVHFGWKNFYDEDPQIASPADTVGRTPMPLMVSYQ